MLVELKNGETLNGHLVTCDTWMNLTLKEVVQTSPVRFIYPRLRTSFNKTTRLEGRRIELTCLGFRMGTSSSDYRRFMLRAIMYVCFYLGGA